MPRIIPVSFEFDGETYTARELSIGEAERLESAKIEDATAYTVAALALVLRGPGGEAYTADHLLNECSPHFIGAACQAMADSKKKAQQARPQSA